MDYRCAKCREPKVVSKDQPLLCEKCGCKIFYKDRPDGGKKILKTD